MTNTQNQKVQELYARATAIQQELSTLIQEVSVTQHPASLKDAWNALDDATDLLSSSYKIVEIVNSRV